MSVLKRSSGAGGGERYLGGLVEHGTLNFSSAQDPRAEGSSPVSGSLLGVKPT